MNLATLERLAKNLVEGIEELRLRPRFRSVEADPVTLGTWCRREQAFTAFGLSPKRLRKLVTDKKVTAKKLDPHDRNSVVIFNTMDIMRAIDEMPDYHYEQTDTTTGEHK